MRNIIVIGSGARECAILMKLHKSEFANNYNFITVGTNINPFFPNKSRFILVDNYDLVTLQGLDIYNDVEFVIIGPEAPIVGGLTNWLNEIGIFAFAPTKENAKIESSKGFARRVIESDINSKFNPRFQIISDNALNLYQRLQSIKQTYGSDIVIKKDGLCGGKGVYVEGDHFNMETLNNDSVFIRELTDYLSNSDNSLIIEEKLEGLEFSLMTLTNGDDYVNLKPVLDYKRLEDDDKGPNTGSMGCVLPKEDTLLNLIDTNIVWEAESVNRRVINYLSELNNVNYHGVLYGSFMISNNELKVIEFNCRFGDPEGAVALLNLKLDLIDIINSAKNGVLSEIPTQKKSQTNLVGVYLVPENYGIQNNNNVRNFDIYFRGELAYINNIMINGDVSMLNSNLKILYGDCTKVGEHIYTRNSRTILLVGEAEYLYKAVNIIYKNIDNVVSRLKYRTDIGSKYLSKYEMAGVSITNANSTLSNIREMLQSTYNDNVRSELGDFGGVYNLNGERLVSSIDGVGTKTDFVDKYFTKCEYEGLGEDIVNHSINDILVMGAQPLFFLDYYGTSALDSGQFTSFIKGASKALCFDDSNTIPLIGGETAEMPSVYKWEKNDIVGCIIGKLDKTFIDFPRQPLSGDYLLALKSVSPHTNGFSLINKINWNIETDLDLLNTLKTPHKNYLPEIKMVASKYGNQSIIRMCHITGGGLIENLSRVVPEHLNIEFHDILEHLYPNWCRIIETAANISRDEMYKVFNCGIGFVVIVDRDMRDNLLENFDFFEIGFLK